MNIDYLHIGLLAVNSYSLVRRLKNNMIDNYYWVIGINKTTEKFYTSDHPVVQRQSMNNIFATAGSYTDFSNLSDQIAFPLSPEVVLMLFNKYEKVNRQQRLFNRKKVLINDISVVNNLKHYAVNQIL
ncbi:hypothetical protein PAENIP36_09510 [Paenibacillus sp. P36]